MITVERNDISSREFNKYYIDLIRQVNMFRKRNKSNELKVKKKKFKAKINGSKNNFLIMEKKLLCYVVYSMLYLVCSVDYK